MATPVAASIFSTDGLRNFATAELQILSVTGTSAGGSFATGPGINATDCMVYNGGSNGAYLVFSTAASPTALNNGGGASGTPTTYCAAGAYIVLQKGPAANFAAICDGSSTTTLYLHAGRGA